ncbi:MAG TPA: trimethyllysine dioxygenase [Steroidobacteraceae bacterium]
MYRHEAARNEDRVLLSSAELIAGQVVVNWHREQSPAQFSPFWLRDHCHAKHSLNADTLQREVDTFAIPQDIAPQTLEIKDGGAALHILWKHDASTSIFPAQFLWNVAQRDAGPPAPRRTLWDRDSMGKNFPCVSHAEVMGSDAGLLRWLSLVEEFGFALTTGAPVSMAATEALVKRVGYVRETIFGGMWEFSANQAFKDTAYTSVAIGPHTDGTYSNDSPGFQMFHCLQFDGSGGDSTLVDGFKVAEAIRNSDRQAFEVLSEVKVPAHYLGDGVHLRAEHPIIGLDQNGDLEQIAYNNYDRAPFRLPPARMAAFYRALALFHRLINDPTYEISMRLTPGTVLFFDNWRTLHGRHAFQGHRHLCGAYLNMEDFQSKLRVLRTRADTP